MAVRDFGTEVVVVGAGPVGLLLAVELRRSGVPVVVLERLTAAMSESRASQLSTLTAELLHERGFDALLEEAERELRAHFGGLPLDLSDLPSDYAGNWKVPQYRTEAALDERLAELGGVLLRGHELGGISEFDDHVVCWADSPAGECRIRARYVVGCDGASSTVRRLCGFAVSQTVATKEMLRADVTGLDIPNRRFERLERGLAVAATRDGVTRVMVHEFGRGAASRTAAPQFAEVVRLWQRVTGDDISGADAIWVDSFDNARGLVTSYRQGRVLLAGDAAHWHMPIGGQALNVGLQDAVNLGWKLAGSVHGWAPPGLLDSYHSERHAVAARVLESVVAQEVLLLGGGAVEPLRAVLAELFQLRRTRDHVARIVSGLDVRYGTGEHPLAGRRISRVELQDWFGVAAPAELVTGVAGVILRLTDSEVSAADGDEDTATLTSGCRLRIVHAVPVRTDVLDGTSTVLLRPDGYVAWAGNGETNLDSALVQWFGGTATGRGPTQSRAERNRCVGSNSPPPAPTGARSSRPVPPAGLRR
jgi:2-polyprenyl-6-methoxyphenol hydroxylase-like FAD-dependent oxidoreductase